MFDDTSRCTHAAISHYLALDLKHGIASAGASSPMLINNLPAIPLDVKTLAFPRIYPLVLPVDVLHPQWTFR
jgi:hypothetical protein